MIWTNGQIVPDDDFRVSVHDRVFEHGLGLFETFRTWNRRPVLLDRHLARLRRSAKRLNLPLREEDLPTDRDVSEMLDQHHVRGDACFRITTTGGNPPALPCQVWMTMRPLPPSTPDAGVVAMIGPMVISFEDPLARHKTLNYWARRIAHETAISRGANEAILLSHDAMPIEGARANLFVVRDGTLITPSLEFPVLPGVFRELVVAHAREMGRPVLEVAPRSGAGTPLGLFEDHPDEVFLTNSVRGIIPVARVFDAHLTIEQSFSVMSPKTRELRDRIHASLLKEGIPQ